MTPDPAAGLLIEALRSLQRQRPVAQLALWNARPHPKLAELAAEAELACFQPFRPDALELEAMGCAVHPVPASADRIGWLGEKGRAKNRARIAQALDMLGAGTEYRLIACAANREGARSIESDLNSLGLDLEIKNRARCRCMTVTGGIPECRLLGQWRNLGRPARAEAFESLVGAPFFTRAGVFSWEAPDPGSRLLLDTLPRGIQGRVMDLCAGSGLLAAGLVRKEWQIQELHLVEADAEALECAQTNLRARGIKAAAHWLDAAREPLPQGMDAIVCNPPFHAGHRPSIELGRQIVARALDALAPGGVLWFVANRHLPYEQTLRRHARKWRSIREERGYKVIEATR